MNMNMDLSIGAFLYYPGIGVGVITDICLIDIGDQSIEVLVLQSVQTDLTVQVPLSNLAGLGVRPVASSERLEAVLDMLLKPHPISDKQATWNRRFREYTEKLQSGQLVPMCEVLAELHQIRVKKHQKKGNLSFGERRMYDKVHGLLSAEVALVKEMDESSAGELIDQLLETGTGQLRACA